MTSDSKIPSRSGRGSGGNDKPVRLKDVAEYLNLAPATVSLVLNDSPAANSIPPATKERVFAAARELRYRPDYLARSLRKGRSLSVGVLLPEISEAYAAEVMSGIESRLLQEGYFYLVASHRRSTAGLLEDSLHLLEHRMVEGLILVATEIPEAPVLPTVVISGHTTMEGVTNVVVDHDRAAQLALSHLSELGHERIAFFLGQPGSSDTEERWRAIRATAASLGLEIRPELTLQLSDENSGKTFSVEEGYPEGYAYGQMLLDHRPDFTALFAFNDVSALGAIRAFLDAGLRVPDDVSVVGFDDIKSAAFTNPRLTTVRQPMREMGETAARILLQRLGGESTMDGVFVTVEPELIIRDSTGPALRRR